MLDKTLFYERVVELSHRLNKPEVFQTHIDKALARNPENLSYILAYLNEKKIAKTELKNFNDVVEVANSSEEIANKLLNVIQNELKPKVKSKILNKFELALSNGDSFKKIFNDCFLLYVKQNIPSIFINVKFIYTQQPQKIPQIEEILLSHVNAIKAGNKLDITLSSGEVLDIVPNIIWVNYYAALHYDYCRNLEEALVYINKAIDSTPSVVEFYMVKSKVLKHGGQLEEAKTVYDLGRKLDLGDRYLNAKYAKTQVRNGEVEASVETIKEFVKDPLADENLDHFQCMWFETECGYAYMKKKSILHAHRLFKYILSHFYTLVEDQVTIIVLSSI